MHYQNILSLRYYVSHKRKQHFLQGVKSLSQITHTHLMGYNLPQPGGQGNFSTETKLF